MPIAQILISAYFYFFFLLYQITDGLNVIHLPDAVGPLSRSAGRYSQYSATTWRMRIKLKPIIKTFKCADDFGDSVEI